jgi:polyhydroxyalkanoate synthesis repressor PhaR
LAKTGTSLSGARHGDAGAERLHRIAGQPWERRHGGHQLQRLGHQGRVLGQGRQVILPEIQQFAGKLLQPRLLLGVENRLRFRLLEAGLGWVGGHANPAFRANYTWLFLTFAMQLLHCQIGGWTCYAAMHTGFKGRPRMTNGQDNGKPAVRIKKYANRRLYNTATSSYVTLDYLAQMVREGQDFTVEDAKTGEDITRSVLTQIIVEEEAKGQTMLPINFLRQLISLYGDNLQFLVPRYLEQSMEAFGKNQEQMRQYMKESFGGMFPFDRFQEMSKQNIAFFEQAMRMWSPFRAGQPGGQPGAAPEAPAAARPEAKSNELDDLKSQMQALQKQLETLAQSSKKSDKPE